MKIKILYLRSPNCYLDKEGIASLELYDNIRSSYAEGLNYFKFLIGLKYIGSKNLFSEIDI